MDGVKSKAYEYVNYTWGNESEYPAKSSDYIVPPALNKQWSSRVFISIVIVLVVSIVINCLLIGVTIKYSRTQDNNEDCVIDADPKVCRSCAELYSMYGDRLSGIAPWKKICSSTTGDLCCLAIVRPLMDVITLRDVTRTDRKPSNEEAADDTYNAKEKSTSRVDTVADTETGDGNADMGSIQITANRPAAHLILNVTALSITTGSLAWTTEEDAGMTFLINVKLLDHSIVISVPGLYYIYSFITFVCENSTGGQMFNHYIYRGAATMDSVGMQLLQMDKQTKRAGQLEYQTSFLAGVFRLERGDVVLSAVSDVKDVYKSAFSNFLGLFML